MESDIHFAIIAGVNFLAALGWQHYFGITICVAIAECLVVGWHASSLSAIRAWSLSVRKDFFYWLLSVSGITRFATTVTAIAAFQYLSSSVQAPKMLAGLGPAAHLLAAFVINDFFSYWTHRLMHLPLFWEAHKVHHSATSLNVLITHRFHPLENLVTMVQTFGVSFAIGATPVTFALVVIVDDVLGQIQHCRVKWDYGILGRILVSPTFHRLHHSRLPEDYNMNFGGRLVIWDRLFGTHSPKDIPFDAVGTGEAEHGLVTEFIHPFKAMLLFPYRMLASRRGQSA